MTDDSPTRTTPTNQTSASSAATTLVVQRPPKKRWKNIWFSRLWLLTTPDKSIYLGHDNNKHHTRTGDNHGRDSTTDRVDDLGLDRI